MSRFDWSLLVWGIWLSLFLIFELIAVFWDNCPWETLSSTSWGLEGAWHLLQYFIIFGLGVLMVHIVAKWPGH